MHKKDNKIFSIFAIGDNDGNVSVWKICRDLELSEMKAIKLFKSHQEGQSMIEDMTWSADV